MNKKGWYLVLILGFLLVTIWLGKWIGLQSQMDFIDLALGLMTGIGLIVAASIKIKRESPNCKQKLEIRENRN